MQQQLPLQQQQPVLQQVPMQQQQQQQLPVLQQVPMQQQQQQLPVLQHFPVQQQQQFPMQQPFQQQVYIQQSQLQAGQAVSPAPQAVPTQGASVGPTLVAANPSQAAFQPIPLVVSAAHQTMIPAGNIILLMDAATDQGACGLTQSSAGSSLQHVAD